MLERLFLTDSCIFSSVWINFYLSVYTNNWCLIDLSSDLRIGFFLFFRFEFRILERLLIRYFLFHMI